MKIKFTLITLLLFSNVSLAWNAAGHHLMAAITWELMSAEEKNYWVDILEHHPRFRSDFKSNIPKFVKRNPQHYQEWVFRRAATWPDVARGLQQKQQEKYHHSSWHYINYPIYLDKKINTKHVNLATDFHGDLHKDLNIMQALQGNIAVLSKQGASKREKALALSWVLHLVGDSHQPMHSSALFSKTYFPKGDRGGNLTKIKGQGHFDNLHWYWDARLENTTSFKIVDLKAKKLIAKHHNIGLKNQHNSLTKQMRNTRKIANKYAYPKEVTKPLKQAEKKHKKQPKINISNAYDIQARKTSQTQIIRAAYQMLEILSIPTR
ncbi:MAG: S1/P1 nuclease [Proteobacteria bacterium]|nr:S1/P1 nuclease [Pseudomonadota bacterium]